MVTIPDCMGVGGIGEVGEAGEIGEYETHPDTRRIIPIKKMIILSITISPMNNKMDKDWIYISS